VNKELGWTACRTRQPGQRGCESRAGEKGDKLIVVEVWIAGAQGEFLSFQAWPALAGRCARRTRIEWFDSVMDIHRTRTDSHRHRRADTLVLPSA